MTKPQIRDDVEGSYLRQRLEEADLKCQSMIAQFRSKDWNEDELSAAILGIGKKGTLPWKQELLYMLTTCEGEPFSSICKAVGITTKTLMKARRSDDEIRAACQDYLGAYFEGEAMVPERCIRPQIVVTALTSHAQGWKNDEQATLTPDKVQTIIRGIIDAVRLEVKDPDVLRRIGEHIKANFDRNMAEVSPSA